MISMVMKKCNAQSDIPVHLQSPTRSEKIEIWKHLSGRGTKINNQDLLPVAKGASRPQHHLTTLFGTFRKFENAQP